MHHDLINDIQNETLIAGCCESCYEQFFFQLILIFNCCGMKSNFTGVMANFHDLN